MAIDYNGIATIIIATSTFITTVGGFVIVTIRQNRMDRKQDRMERASYIRDIKLDDLKRTGVATHDLVNGASKKIEELATKVGFDAGVKQGEKNERDNPSTSGG